MLKAIGQNVVLVGALAVGMTVSGLVTPWLVSERGALGPAVHDAVSLGGGLAAALIALLVATGLAVLTARLTNTAVGGFVLGGGLFGMAWRTATVEEVPWIGGFSGLGIETIVWSLLVLGAVVVLFRLAGPLRDVPPLQGGRVPSPYVSVDALKSAAAGLLVLPVVWIVARSPDKGQAIGAVFCGAMVAGMAGRLLAPNVQPILLFASPIFFGGIGHFIGSALLGGGLDDALVAGAIRPVNLPMPVDYAAGTLMGVAVGLGWARSFLHHEDDEAHAGRPASAA